MLERHRPAYEKQGQRQIRAVVMLPCSGEDKAGVTEGFWAQEYSESEEE